MSAPHVVKLHPTVLPVQSTPQPLEPVGKPGRFDRDRIPLRCRDDLDLRPPRLDPMPHQGGELGVAPRVDVVPDPTNARGERVAEFLGAHVNPGGAQLGGRGVQVFGAEPGSIRGVVTGEDLARFLPRPRIDAVFRDLVAWDIDLFASTRDATGV
jgi:hypothetical protein